ncbi:MAG: enoyl-[acyl-carrier-protein] reductase FabV [Spirochaetales bacterium]|nr:enoyl-[acyl-carrier-protein] reductase FabV [Spirochaetales bacterium]
MEKVINPDIRNFVNITAHPAGCEANVRSQVEESEEKCPGNGIGNALVVGSSAGYGLASIITAVFGYGAKGLGVCFERPIKNRRSAAPGAYNIAALHKIAREKGRYIETINGDAFSHETRKEVVVALKERYGKLDYVIYSVASSRRVDPDNGTLYQSRIKPIGDVYKTMTIDPETETLREIAVEPASEDEISDTVKVMGGTDLKLWVETLVQADLLNPGCRILAYTYIGSEATAPIYRSGTIGAAKVHLEKTARDLDRLVMGRYHGNCLVCSCQAQVTRASSVIPAMPLYLSLLKNAMSESGEFESAVQQIIRLFRQHVSPGRIPQTDAAHLIRLDDRELNPSVQQYVSDTWKKLTDSNFRELADWKGFKEDFIRTAGFGLTGIDYDRGIDNTVNWQ